MYWKYGSTYEIYFLGLVMKPFIYSGQHRNKNKRQLNIKIKIRWSFLLTHSHLSTDNSIENELDINKEILFRSKPQFDFMHYGLWVEIWFMFRRCGRRDVPAQDSLIALEILWNILVICRLSMVGVYASGLVFIIKLIRGS